MTDRSLLTIPNPPRFALYHLARHTALGVELQGRGVTLCRVETPPRRNTMSAWWRVVLLDEGAPAGYSQGDVLEWGQAVALLSGAPSVRINVSMSGGIL